MYLDYIKLEFEIFVSLAKVNVNLKVLKLFQNFEFLIKQFVFLDEGSLHTPVGGFVHESDRKSFYRIRKPMRL